MNKRRLAHIARWLEAGGVHKYVTFDILKGVAFKEIRINDVEGGMACGTTCCIAGAACYFFNDVPKMVKNFWSRDVCSLEHGCNREIGWGIVSNEAKALLDLDEVTATRLFEPWVALCTTQAERSQFNNAAWAARVIRKLIKTGKVDWEGCRETVKQ